MSTVAQIVESVEVARRSLLECLAGLTEPQATFRPGDGQWNILEVVAHLYLAEVSGVSKIWAERAAKASRCRIPNAAHSLSICP